MNKRAKAILISAGVIVVLGVTAAFAGPVIYRDFIAAPAADVPTLEGGQVGSDPQENANPNASNDANASTDASTDANTDASTNPNASTAQENPTDSHSAGAATVTDFTGTWQIGADSFAGYRVDEVLNGTDVTVTGRTSAVSGSLTFAELTLEEAQIEVDVASIATDNQQRDRYFTQQAMRVGEHPKATFVLTEAVTADAAPAVGEVQEYTVTGDLTLAGATQSVTFVAQARVTEAGAQVAGQIPITFADFGIVAPNMGFVAVEPEGYVEFQVSASR